MKRSLTATCFICFLGLANAYGCVLIKKSVDKFDPDEFIFIGIVVGFKGPVEFDGAKANGPVSPISATSVNRSERPQFVTHGLVVKVKESVHLPIKSETFEIFEYSLGADCLVQGISKTDLPGRFPLNSEVRIISKRAIFIQEPSDGHVTLENRLTEDGSIALNIDKSGNRMTSADSIFNYKTYSYDADRDSESKYLLPIFEIRKDLVRLSRLKDQEPKNLILDRIFHAPVAHDIDHGGIFKNHTSGETEYRRYFESHLKATDPVFYLQYRAYQDALDKLIKTGYLKSQAEMALRKAVETGSDIDAAKLFEASLKYLPATKRK